MIENQANLKKGTLLVKSLKRLLRAGRTVRSSRFSDYQVALKKHSAAYR
jgi:hypothetical protein